MIKQIPIFLVLIFFISSAEANIFERNSPEELEKVCVSDIDGKNRVPPLVTNPQCFDPTTLCPIYPKLNKKHRLILVDTTGGLTKAETSYLEGDVFDPNGTLLKEIEPYTKLSVLDLNDKVDVVGLKPLADYCRPQAGRRGTPYPADIPHKSQGAGFVRQQFVKWAKATWETHIKLESTTPAKQTLLFEHIRAVTTVSKFKFREKDYPERTLVLFSDLMQNTERFDFQKNCRIRQRCIDFDTFYKKAGKNDRKYLDEIKPSFSNSSKVIIYHIINKKVKSTNLESHLKEFWLGFFNWAGVEKENITYIRLVDNTL